MQGLRDVFEIRRRRTRRRELDTQLCVEAFDEIRSLLKRKHDDA